MSTDTPDRIRAIVEPHRHTPGGLMPALHAVQDALGHVPEAAVPVLAETFNLSRAEVHGVVSYYHHFRREPAGRHVVQICRAEACQAMGADALLEHVQQRLGCGLGEHRRDGGVTLEAVYCLGLCASSPAMVVDDRLHARMTPQRFDALAARFEAKSKGATA